MPSDKGMSFWGFFNDDVGDDAAAPGMEEFPFPFLPADNASRGHGSGGAGLEFLPVAGAGGGKENRSAPKAENETWSGIDHLDLDADVDAVAVGRRGKRKRAYFRHTPDQIQELQAFFRECSHPNEKQREELGKKLCLKPAQVKFWFQNRRTTMKREVLLHENAQLLKENEKLRAENLSIREAMMHQVCEGCVNPAPGGSSSREEEEHLRVQNASLGAELSRFSALASKLLGSSISQLAPQPTPGERIGSVPPTTVTNSTITELTAGSGSSSMDIDKSVFMKLAASAMDELVKMAHMDEPLWTPTASLPGSLAKETLNYEEYLNTFSPCIEVKPAGFVSETSRESGMVISDSSAALVETLMDERLWCRMFSCMIAKSSTMEEISAGVAGSRDGALLLMQAELRVLSPLVPTREVTFLRFCKQLGEGAWAVVDVSIDGLVMEQGPAVANMKCRRLPSGCVVQDAHHGFCKVTWVEHTEYDESSVHQLCRPLLRSGLALGAGRWFATLQRQCECLDILMPYVAAPKQDSQDVLVDGTRSLLKLAQRMMENFLEGVSASSAAWSKLDGFTGNIGEDLRVMARKSVDEPGVPPGVVLCAATSVWMLVPPKRLFDFLCNEEMRTEWDILSKGGPMQEVTKIDKGQQDGNAVSLLKANATNLSDSSILILQETCTDASGSMVVYAPVDIPAMRHLMGGGGDSTSVALLPSGFVVLPAGPDISGDEHKTCGSLLTVAFQILVNSSQPTRKLTVESVKTVKTLISCTINRIKTALHCEDI